MKINPNDNRTVAEVVASMGGNVRGEASRFGVVLRSDDQALIDQDVYDRHCDSERRTDEFAQYWRAGQ